MCAKAAYRDRDDREVAVLDALVERGREGMTVLEVRSRAAVDIDEVERALEALKTDDLIEVEREGDRTVIRPAPEVIPEPTEDEEPGVVDRVRDRLPF